VHGLDKVMAGELIEFPHGMAGLAMNLDEDQVGAVLLGDYTELAKATRSSARARSCPCRWARRMIGRVVNALGQPIDDKGPMNTTFAAGGAAGSGRHRSPGGARADGDRASRRSTMIPIGRGQRELLIGDRQTGKTAIALDTIINSAKNNLICIYCAIGQKRSSLRRWCRR
jgi:F-type H+-transporting ATPase subunit alpha